MSTYDIVPTILTQGNTGSASVIKVIARVDGTTQLTSPFLVRARVCNEDGYTDATNATIAATSGYAVAVTAHSATKDITFRSAGANATQTLTISGVVIDGQTFTIGTDVFEFDDDSSVTGSNITVDISSYSTQSQGTLTIAEPVTEGDTIRIGNKTYVFVANGTGDTDGEIDLGADEAATKVNIVAAINGTDGYNTANAYVTAAAFAADDCVLTAITGGTAGDAIATVELGQGLTHASNVFDAATLGTTTAGVDCTAANAVTAAVAAINANSSIVRAVDGAGDTVVITHVTVGTAGNSVATTETMANGAWGAANMAGGVAILNGELRISLTNATAETVTLRFGAPDIGGLPIDYTADVLEVTHAAP